MKEPFWGQANEKVPFQGTIVEKAPFLGAIVTLLSILTEEREPSLGDHYNSQK